MNDAPPLPGEKKKRGCWVIGCSVLLVIGIVFVGIIGFGYYKFGRVIDPYLSTTPLEILPVTVSDAQFGALETRIAEFTRVGPGAPNQLALIAADWNALIARSPAWEGARSRLQVRVEGDALSVQGSVPLDKFPGMRGKYMNGEVFIKPAITDGRLRLPVEKIAVTEEAMSPQAQKAFADGLQGAFEEVLANDPILRPVVAKATSVAVKDGAVIFRAGE